MKKFSVLFVTILIALMLIVSCDNKPKERAATPEDAEVIGILNVGSISMISKKVDGVTIVDGDASASYKATFNNAVLEKEDTPIKKKIVICGDMSYSISDDKSNFTFSFNFTKGTSIDGVAHTLTGKVITYKDKTKDTTFDLILDGYKLTDLDKIKIE